LKEHAVFAHAEEKTKHEEMMMLAKIHKLHLRTAHCPFCNFPSGVGKRLGKGNEKDKDKEHIRTCAKCNKNYMLSPFCATYRALNKMGKDGYAKCPKCGILISKGAGCDFMRCGGCGFCFSWERAKQKMIPHAKVPDDEIHLWW